MATEPQLQPFPQVFQVTRIYIGDGTAAVPSIAFISDPDTGISSGGNNILQFSTGGAAPWSITNNILTSNDARASFVFNNGSAETLKLSNSVANATALRVALGHLIIEPAAITAGSGTGVTVVITASASRVVYKVTVDYTALAAAGLTADKTIATIPAKTKLVGIISDTTTKYIGGAVTAATLIVGKTVGGNQYIVSHDVFTAAIMKGGNNIDADFGAALSTGNNVIKGEDLPSWTATTGISVRLTTVTANTNALTQGSTTYYLITEAMP